MNVTERRMAVYSLLQEQGVVELGALAERFGVSTMTVRRDLQHFERQGYVTMSHGAAYLNKGTSPVDPSFAGRTSANAEQKMAIARAVVSHIDDGDAVIVDCGTTTLQVCRLLGNKRITVITNSIPVVGVVGSNPRVKLLVAPGTYDCVSAGMFGDLTVDFFGRLHVDKALIGAKGWSAKEGITDPNMGEASVKGAMLKAARHAFLLADSSKYGKTYLMRDARIEDFDKVFTDPGLDPESRRAVEARGPEVVCVEEGVPLG